MVAKCAGATSICVHVLAMSARTGAAAKFNFGLQLVPVPRFPRGLKSQR